jgi:hypothetical protein
MENITNILIIPFLGLIFLTLLVERITEHFVAAPLKEAKKPTWFVRYVALGFGLLATFGFSFDLSRLIGLSPKWPWIGYIGTAIVISGGANYLNDFFGRLVNIFKTLILKIQELKP